MHNLLFCVHALCMNYETNTLLLVSSSVRSKQLLYFVHGQGQKSEQKPKTKRRVSFTGHIPQVTGTGHSNCAPKQNMFLLKIYIRACLVLLAPLRLFYAVLGQILSDL